MITSKNKILITGGSGFIGTNLIELFVTLGYNFINFDKAKPTKESQTKYWHKGNLLNINSFKKVLNEYKPSIVIHLAARADCESDNIEDYKDNTEGVQNLIDSIKECPSVKHVVVTSTQYVYKSKEVPFPKHDEDYKPHTTYGESKVITEEITRSANLDCAWTIVRPGNVWGAWHLRYPNELWKIIDKGYYVHPSKKEVIRTYGYIKNVTHQINAIISSPAKKVDKRTYYLGDSPIDSFIWLNGISQQLRGKSLKRVPGMLFTLPAYLGDILLKVGINSPIHTVRFKNMTEDFYAPTNITIQEFGLSHPNMQENIKETAEWIKGEGCHFFPYWQQK